MPRPKGITDDQFAKLLINCSTAKYWSYSANATKAGMRKAMDEEKQYNKKVQEDTRRWNAERGKIARERPKIQKLMNQELTTTVGILLGTMNKT